MAERFDAAYYRRFYGRQPVHDRRRIAQLAEGVLSLASWWRIPIRSVLDIGAGKGYWRDWLTTTRPRITYHGIDASEYACRRYVRARGVGYQGYQSQWKPTTVVSASRRYRWTANWLSSATLSR
ncbi:MAG: hypothetical protein ACXV5U_11435, partial [Ilumatobacteraceae bacterium]